MRAIELTAKQKQMLTLSFRTWNFYGGAVRSGKSQGTIFLLPLRISKHYDEPCLFVAKTLATIEKNILRPARELYGALDVGFIKSRADGGRYVNVFGKDVDCVGANDERSKDKIHGTEYGYALCDEMTLYPENFFRMLTSRLSLKGSECDATFNPESPSHYLKQFVDKEGELCNYIHFTIYDNPFLPSEYVRRLEQEYEGTIYFEKWILGNWVRAEGLVFPLFKRERHFVRPEAFTRQTVNDIHTIIVGGDGATTNDATALVPLLIFRDGSAAVGDIFYHNPHENGQLSNAELVPFIRQWYDDILNKYAKNRNVRVYTAVDCAAADLIVTMRKNLPSNYNITAMTHKDIQQTTDIVNNAFGLDMVKLFDFGGYRNYVRNRWVSGLLPLVVELETMVWDDKNDGYDDSVPNDAADAFRYAVCTYYNNPENLWTTPDLGL